MDPDKEKTRIHHFNDEYGIFIDVVDRGIEPLFPP